MEFVNGPSLKDELKKRDRLPVHEVRRIGLQILDALEFAHNEGVVHRDIKPGNILLRRNQALLADFGIATVADWDGETLTDPRRSPGTPTYMSPEQKDWKIGPVDRRSDLFSLGLTLRQCLLGLSDEEVRNPGKKAWRRMPTDVRAVIEKALVEQPDERWQSAGEFRERTGADVGTVH